MNTTWNNRFLQVSELVASWSKDPSTKCGAVIVRPDKTVASVGYNGFPMGCSDADELYANREEKYQRVIHAEVNAVLHAREPLHGYTMFTTPAGIAPTCDRCATVVIQSGITTVVHEYEESSFALRWKPMMDRALEMYRQAGVEVIDL